MKNVSTASDGWSLLGVPLSDAANLIEMTGTMGVVVLAPDARVHVEIGSDGAANVVVEVLFGPGLLVAPDVRDLLASRTPAAAVDIFGYELELVLPVVAADGSVAAIAHVWAADLEAGLSLPDKVAILRAVVEPPSHGRGDEAGLELWKAKIERRTLWLSVAAVATTVVGIAIGLALYAMTQRHQAKIAQASTRGQLGALTLPTTVRQGPIEVISAASSGDRPFVVQASPNPPRFTGKVEVGGCSTQCTLNLGVVGVPRPLGVYSLMVFPSTGDNFVSPVAGGFNDDGTGEIVENIPFAEGWVCFRVFSALTLEQAGSKPQRTRWSSAECYYLDQDGAITTVRNKA